MSILHDPEAITTIRVWSWCPCTHLQIHLQTKALPHRHKRPRQKDYLHLSISGYGFGRKLMIPCTAQCDDFKRKRPKRYHQRSSMCQKWLLFIQCIPVLSKAFYKWCPSKLISILFSLYR